MKNLSELEMNQIQGEGFLSNYQCMLLGAIAIGSAAGQVWGAAAGVTATAVVGGCLDSW